MAIAYVEWNWTGGPDEPLVESDAEEPVTTFGGYPVRVGDLASHVPYGGPADHSITAEDTRPIHADAELYAARAEVKSADRYDDISCQADSNRVAAAWEKYTAEQSEAALRAGESKEFAVHLLDAGARMLERMVNGEADVGARFRAECDAGDRGRPACTPTQQAIRNTEVKARLRELQRKRDAATGWDPHGAWDDDGLRPLSEVGR